MKFRPCIDIHNGSVKQIVGGSLQDQGSQAVDNFISEQDAAFYADKYKEAGLKGGHIILLNPAGSEYYEKDIYINYFVFNDIGLLYGKAPGTNYRELRDADRTDRNQC